MTVIQLLGQARSGKDWTAEQLKAYFESQGKSVEVMSYAGPMKRIISTIFDISLEELDTYKNCPLEYVVDITQLSDFKVPTDIHNTDFRRILQLFGNEAMKTEFGNSVWADLMATNIAKSSADVVIIPDCRFHAELQAFPEAVTVRVINHALPAPMQHASELELLNYQTSYTLNNTNQSATEQDIAELAKEIL